MNKLLKHQFHAQNIPVKRKFLWDKFICCVEDKTLCFENVPPVSGSGGFNAKHFSRVLDWLFVFGEYGIRYVDYDNGKLVAATILDDPTAGLMEFTWAELVFDRIWFGGVNDRGIWYSLLSEPFTIMQSNITTGTFTGIMTMGAGYNNNEDRIVFLSSNGGRWFDTTDLQLKPHTLITADFKGGVGGYFYGGTGSYTGLWYRQQTLVADDIYGHTISEKGNFIFFRNNRVFEVVPGSTSYNSYDSALTLTRRGAISRQWMLYLVSSQGLYNFSAKTWKSSDGYTWIEMGKDGDMYLCGSDGSIYYYDEYNDKIVDTGKTGGYTESCVGADGKMYFAGDDVARLVTNNAGNTGDSVAMEFNVHRMKYGKDEVVESYSMLNGVAPEITVEELRRMTKADIDLRAGALLSNINLSGENSHYSNTPDLCPIGERGFLSQALGGKINGYNSPGSGQESRYDYVLGYLGQMHHTWNGYRAKWIIMIYLDNISCWKSGRNKIELQGRYGGGVFNPTIGFIDLPPEEWDMSTPSSTYALIYEKMQSAKHAITYPAGTPVPWDISKIYEGPEAKTLVVYSKTDVSVYESVSLQNARIMVNGEILWLKLYTFMLAVWSERVSGRAKMLTLTTAISNQISEYSILDPFGTNAGITETDYTQMSEEDVRERAGALLEYAAGGNAYRENNSVIV